MKDQVWTPEKISSLIRDNSTMVERSLLVLFSRQTDAEQKANATMITNHMGFTGVDASILSSFAKQIKGSAYPIGRRLSPKQLAIARRKLPKYAKQLATYANTKQALKVESALGIVNGDLFKKGGTYTPLEDL